MTALLLCQLLTVQAQKKNYIQAEQERRTSVTFANGLRDYYTGNLVKAEEVFLGIAETTPTHGPSNYMLGKIKHEAQDYVVAEHFLNRALKAEKNNVWYLAEMAEVYDEEGKSADAAKLWGKACALSPQNETFLLNYADATMRTGKIKETLKALDRIELLNGSSDEITMLKAQIHLYNNDVKGAVGEYDRAIKNAPYNADNYLSAAEIYISNGQSDKAIGYLEKANQIDPGNGSTQLMLGNYYQARGDQSTAFQYWLSAVKSTEVTLEQKMPILRIYLSSLKDKPATPEQVELAQALTEANPEAVEGWAALGSIHLRGQDYAQGAHYFAKAIEVDPSQYAIWSDYVYCLAKSQNFNKIIELKQEITELFPSNSMMLFMVGSAYLQTSKAAEAIPYLEKAAKYTYDKTELSHIYSSIAEAYEALGNQAKAEEYRKKANK